MNIKKIFHLAKDPQKSNKIRIGRFIIIYIILIGAFWFLIGYKPIQNIFDINGIYTHFIVVTTVNLLGAIGIPCTYEGSLIHLPTISVNVVFGCNGLEAVLIYSIAVLAFPARWNHKIIGIVAGFLIIQIINIMRILVVTYSATQHFKIFEIVHVYIAQGIMIAVALGVFLLYLRYLNYGEKKREAFT